MPLIPVNLSGPNLAAPGEVDSALQRAFATHANAPIHILIHGYKHSPFAAQASPHSHILGLEQRPCWKATSWPAALGIGRVCEPICLALGWEARGTLWSAYARAGEAGRGLASLMARIRAQNSGAQPTVLAHSLGARVCLAALPYLAPGSLRLAVLLAPAELAHATAELVASPAGRSLNILHATTQENAAFDRALEWLMAPHRPGARALGNAPAPSVHWTTLAIDSPAARAGLRSLGYVIPPPDRRVCHWSVYTRAGLLPLYRDVLTGRLPLVTLRNALSAGQIRQERAQPNRCRHMVRGAQAAPSG